MQMKLIFETFFVELITIVIILNQLHKGTFIKCFFNEFYFINRYFTVLFI
jgi:hypothetical protein